MSRGVLSNVKQFPPTNNGKHNQMEMHDGVVFF